LFEGLVPIPDDFMQPKKNFIAHIFEADFFLIFEDHLCFLLDELRIISQTGFDQSVSVLGIEISEFFLFFESLLKLFIVGLHIEGGVLLAEVFNFEHSLISFSFCLCEESDWLMQSSQSTFDFIDTDDCFLKFFIGFNLLPPDLVLKEIFDLFQSFLPVFLLFELFFPLLLFVLFILFLNDLFLFD
jgi:hypothetical protein